MGCSAGSERSHTWKKYRHIEINPHISAEYSNSEAKIA
jgi:hypothetical protein